MSDLIKEWLLEMFDSEIEEVNGTISNNRLWLVGCASTEEAIMYEENIVNLVEYRDVLKKLREQTKKGELPYDL